MNGNITINSIIITLYTLCLYTISNTKIPQNFVNFLNTLFIYFQVTYYSLKNYVSSAEKHCDKRESNLRGKHACGYLTWYITYYVKIYR